MHCIKSVHIRSYSGPHFSRIFPHLDWTRRETWENRDQNNSEYRLFLRRLEEHLHFSENFWMITTKLIHFLSYINQFPVRVSRDFMSSVSMGLGRIQLSDLIYRMADWHVREIHDRLLIYLFIYLFACLFLSFFLFIYLFAL